ncbi:thiosulfate:glutathione sulfurtransferase-like [Bombina bombina]|uniref:thiosulfate:glutathione sulfurtransferase-like n=1 Tax=Bombina bombina TaxID=8345 RepID=UPI00235B05DD|nr:thiosulfate:glutathione sulfurtransferase-like [Bombina bombina]
MSTGVISYDELKKLKGQIFDVRSPDEVEKGKIQNSVNIPVNYFENALKLDPETFKYTYGVNKPSLQDEDFVVHCQMGRRGARAANIAAAIGYKHVQNYAGGFKEWSEKGGN